MAEPDAGAGVGGDWAPSVGARVRLHSLLRTPEHNGAEGEVVEFEDDFAVYCSFLETSFVYL